MLLTITFLTEQKLTCNVTLDTFQKMKQDRQNSVPEENYPIEPSGSITIHWAAVKSLEVDAPAVPVVIAPPPVFTKESMENW